MYADDYYTLMAEFIGETRDTLSQFDILMGNLRSHATSADEGIAHLRAELTRLHALAQSAHHPLIELAVHRLGNYLIDIGDPTDDQFDDIEAFLDVVRGILDQELDREADEAEFVRSLPARRPVDTEDLAHLNVEILVVDPNRATARIVERGIINCGYRITTANRSFDALELAVRTRTDMVISSAVLDEMNDIDLCCALAAMPATEKIPFALLTSFSPEHESMKRLPESASLLRKGQEFGEGLADGLSRFDIT